MRTKTNMKEYLKVLNNVSIAVSKMSHDTSPKTAQVYHDLIKTEAAIYNILSNRGGK